MLITRDAENYKRFSNNTNFDLFICVGEEPGNNILRSMENPRHDTFSLDRIEDEDEKKAAKKAYNAFSEEVKALLAELAPLIVEQTSIIDDLDDLLKLQDSNENLADEGDEASTKAKLSGVRTTHPTRMLKPAKGKGHGKKSVKPGGKKKRPWWHGALTSRWSDVSQAQALRVVPKVASSGLVSVFLTAPLPGKYCLELYRAGESENQFIRVEQPSSMFFEIKEPNQRVELKPQLDPKDLAFAIEGLIHVVSK